MSHHKLEANGICFTYPDGHPAIRDLSMLITHGESVGIIGANGAGKSTLLLLLLGIYFPEKGQIRIGDVPVTAKTLPVIRQRLGLVFQDADDQLFMPTVYDDVAFGPRNYKLDEQTVAERVDAALAAVGILHLKDRAPFKLSGGEKRAAAIATVLAMQPDVLIMDEPTANLDPRARRQVIAQLQAFEHTKIIASHDLDMIAKTCQRILILSQGTVAADGPADVILADETLLVSCGLA
jgi:cobalt/nickel transport system ATP-binding protein